MTTLTAEFEELEKSLDQRGVAGILERLTDQLREKKDYHRLFEALKMQLLHRFGLPLDSWPSSDELDEPRRREFEQSLYNDVCREVGMLLIREGRIRDGWMYMSAVGDSRAVADALSEADYDEDNLDEVIDVALYQGVAPKLGYQLVLEHQGTCPAITAFESFVARELPKEKQCEIAAVLVRHLHDELLASVKADVAQQEGAEPTEPTLREMLADRDWLLLEGSYHIDVTHLSSTVRYARLLEDEEPLKLVLDLTEYGRRLDQQFQHPDDEPFADFYPSHALYFQALLRENVNAAVSYFREKAETVNVDEQGAAPIEVYVDLLARIERYDDAIDATIRLLPDGARSLSYAPSLLELSGKAGSYDALLAFSKQHDDLLGFATGLVQAKLQESSSD